MHHLIICLHSTLPSAQSPLSAILRGLVDICMLRDWDASHIDSEFKLLATKVLHPKGSLLSQVRCPHRQDSKPTQMRRVNRQGHLLYAFFKGVYRVRALCRLPRFCRAALPLQL